MVGSGRNSKMLEPQKRLQHLVIGFIVVMAHFRHFQFLFTISPGSVLTEDFIYWLTLLHYRNKIVFVRDNLGGHKAEEEFFQLRHPDWFDFVSFPTYSPELNPVESYWNGMKQTDLANFVP
jgi:transposase